MYLKKQIFIILSLILICHSEILTNFTEDESFFEIIYEEFKYDNCVFVTYDDYNNLFAENILRYIQSKTIFNSSLRIDNDNYQAFIIVVQSIENVIDYFDRLSEMETFDKRAKYFIIYTDEIDKNNFLKTAFNYTMKYTLLNVNILTKDYEIFTYFPYNNGKCGRDITPIKLNDTKLYPEKVPLDLKGCPIKLTGVRIIPYVLDITASKNNPGLSGLEVTIIYTIFKKMNFTQIYVANTYPHWGYMLKNGKFTMTYKSLQDKNVDIIFGMMIGNSTMSKHFDVTYPHIDTTAVWFVPVALPIAQWKNLTVIFDGIVWTAILIVVISNGVAWYILGRKREKLESFNEISLCLMGAFYILLQGSVTTPHTWKLRFVVIIWSISSLLLFTAHQCQLTGILTSPLYEHQISNIKEMVSSHLDFGFYPILRSLYKESSNPAHKKLLKKYKPCPLTTECMNRTAFKRDFATIKNKREASYLMSKYYSFPSGKPMLYSFKESEFVVWCKYYVEKGFPFLDRINENILLLQSNGLISKWEHDLVAGSNSRVEVNNLEPLSLNHLQGAFFLLLFGNLAAFIMFLYEKFKFNVSILRMKRKNNKKYEIEDISSNIIPND